MTGICLEQHIHCANKLLLHFVVSLPPAFILLFLRKSDTNFKTSHHSTSINLQVNLNFWWTALIPHSFLWTLRKVNLQGATVLFKDLVQNSMFCSFFIWESNLNAKISKDHGEWLIHTAQVYFLPVLERTALHALCLLSWSPRIKHKIAVEAAVQLNYFSLATEFKKASIWAPFFSPKATKGHTAARFLVQMMRPPEGCSAGCCLHQSRQCRQHECLTNIDRVLPVLQHLRDDEDIHVRPVLPVPVLEGKGSAVTMELKGQRHEASTGCTLLCWEAAVPHAQFLASYLAIKIIAI